MHIQVIATTFQTELKAAIIAQRMGDSTSYHRLTDYVINQTKCELWELVESLDIINIQEFDGENPFTARLQIADNMIKMIEAQAKEADRLRNIHARMTIPKHDIEGAILARQEKSEHWLWNVLTADRAQAKIITRSTETSGVKMKANFKEWGKGQKVKGKYLGMVEYEGTINGDRSRWAPKGNTFIFVVTLTKEMTVFDKTKKVGGNIEIWESDKDDSTIEKIEE